MTRSAKRGFGIALTIAGMISFFLGGAAFAATEDDPVWLEHVGGVCFWIWWLILGCGLQLLWSARSGRPGE